MNDAKNNKTDNHIADPIFERHAAFCSIFAAPIRLRILWLLQDGEQSVGYLSETLNTSMANVSQHLRTMRNQGALLTRKEGKQVFYRIANRKFMRGANLIREGLMENLQKEKRSAVEQKK